MQMAQIAIHNCVQLAKTPLKCAWREEKMDCLHSGWWYTMNLNSTNEWIRNYSKWHAGKIGTTKQDVTGFHGPTTIDMKIDNVDLEGSTNHYHAFKDDS